MPERPKPAQCLFLAAQAGVPVATAGFSWPTAAPPTLEDGQEGRLPEACVIRPKARSAAFPSLQLPLSPTIFHPYRQANNSTFSFQNAEKDLTRQGRQQMALSLQGHALVSVSSSPALDSHLMTGVHWGRTQMVQWAGGGLWADLRGHSEASQGTT